MTDFDWKNKFPQDLIDYISKLDVSAGIGQYVFYQGISHIPHSDALANAGFSMINNSAAAAFFDDNLANIHAFAELHEIEFNDLAYAPTYIFGK